MEMLGSVARIDAGGAVGRRSGSAPVPAASRPGGSGEGRGQRGGATIAKHAGDDVASQAKAAAPRRESAELPPAVQIDGLYEKRVGNGRGGLYVDLVYKNSGLRAARLIGRADTGATEDNGEGEQAVAAGTVARAYRAPLGGELAATTELTG
jgi:hypothetical protein